MIMCFCLANKEQKLNVLSPIGFRYHASSEGPMGVLASGSRIALPPPALLLIGEIVETYAAYIQHTYSNQGTVQTHHPWAGPYVRLRHDCL